MSDVPAHVLMKQQSALHRAQRKLSRNKSMHRDTRISWEDLEGLVQLAELAENSTTEREHCVRVLRLLAKQDRGSLPL